MTPLVQDLWDLEERQSDWQENEFQANDHGKARLQRFLREILERFDAHIEDVAHGYVALAGLECGWFQPAASLRRDLEQIGWTATDGQHSSVARHLPDSGSVVLIDNPAVDPEYKGDRTARSRCILKLIATEECYGFIVLDSRRSTAFSSYLKVLEKAQRVLSRIVADALFSMRLRLLGAPIQLPLGPPSLANVTGIAMELASRTAYGFGADCSVLRLYNPQTDLLEIAGTEGDLPSDLARSLAINEGVAGRVYGAGPSAWFLSSSAAHSDEQLRGTHVPAEDQARITGAGFHSYVVMNLSHYTSVGELVGLGTLSFLHRRPHKFSWQEVSLFQSFCQSAAETLSLIQKHIALEESAENIRLQNLMLTRVEIVALLAHDLGHRTMQAALAVEDYISACRKTLNNQHEVRSHAHLEDRATKALQATQQIGSALNQFRQLYKNESELTGRRSDFDLGDVIRYVESTLSGALERRKIKVKFQPSGSMKLHGHEEILIQVLFNLVINSIEAIASMTRVRPTFIHIHAHEEKQANPRRIIMQFWDEGPGINQRIFPRPDEIFEVGRSSKPTGTGTGLPVARRLLSQYFSGDISLASPEDARFRIVLPDRPS